MAGTENIFSLKGIGKKPLPQDCIVIDCQVRKVTRKILWVPNYTKNKLTYKVNFCNNVTTIFLSKGLRIMYYNSKYYCYCMYP